MKSKFHITKPFTEVVDNERHPLFQDVTPLTPQQMLYRQQQGMPISVSTPEARFTINNKFHSGDKLDVYDTLYRQKKKLDSKIKDFEAAKAAQAAKAVNEKVQVKPEQVSTPTDM